jgi:polysaccharide chain length determinant protein (PEP-CTERM system associated)
VDQRTQVKFGVDVLWRRRLWILVLAAVGLAGGIFAANWMPNVYRASTTILVLRQSILDDLVRKTATTRVEERISSLKIQVKSRSYLEQVVTGLHMVPPNATRAEIELACTRLDLKVELDWDKVGLSWFKITADDGDAKRAADIANRLADLFIEQSSEIRGRQVTATVDTVEGWLEKTEKELRKRDAELAKYKAENLYELPDQQAATLQLLNSAQSRVQQLTGDIQRREERLATLRTEDEERRAAARALGVNGTGDSLDARAYAQMQRELQDLVAQYTEENPLVKRKRKQIAQFAASHPGLVAISSGDVESPVIQPSPELTRLADEIRGFEADRNREQRNIEMLRHRIEKMPQRQQELAELTRDYETLKRSYDASVSDRVQATRAQDIEAAKKGEQFQIQDRANPPVKPVAPNKPFMVIFGLLAGLGLGAGLAVALEFLAHTVWNEEEFAHRYPHLTILGSIPNLDADMGGPRKSRGRRARSKAAEVALVGAAAVAHLLLVLGGPPA